MSSIFELVGRIAIDNEEAKKSIDDTIEKAKALGKELNGTGGDADELSGKIGKGSSFGTSTVFMGQMLANTAVGVGKFVKKFASSGIDLASDLEQSIGGVETLFGDATEMVFENADRAYKTAGMSANKYMQTITTFAAALKRSTETEAEAARIADMAIIDMSDNANKMGTDMKSIQNAYQGFAKQNYTMLDNLKLGYGGTKGEMERLLEDAENLTGQKYDLSNLSDVFQAVHAIQVEMGIAGTTAEEASSTWAGSASSAKSAWDNFIATTMLDVLPTMTEALNKVMSFAEKNPETIQKFADALSGLASISIDAITGLFQFLVDNGKPIGVVLGIIAAGLAAGAVAAHPYAAAIMAVVGGLAALTAHENKVKGGEILAKYSEEDLANLQAYVNAERELQEAQKAWDGDWGIEATDRLHAAQDAVDTTRAAVNKTKGLMDDYYAYIKANGVGKGEDIYLDVPTRISEDSESNMQGEMDGMTLEAKAKIYPDLSEVYAAQNTALTFYANVVPSYSSGTKVDGSHAGGLDRVPFDGYIARLHKDEAVLRSTEATAYRAGQLGGNTGRVEAMLTQAIGVLQQIVANTSSSTQVVLDSGVLVGQLAPAMDAQLGTILNRKGRRN